MFVLHADAYIILIITNIMKMSFSPVLHILIVKIL